jgi:hypothetical protein
VPCSTFQRFSETICFSTTVFISLQWYPVHEISFVVFFLVPVLLLAFLYIAMVRVIREATKTPVIRWRSAPPSTLLPSEEVCPARARRAA